MGDIGMIKRGGSLPGSSAEREEGVVIDVVDHRGINSGLGVYRREEGEETVNTRKHMHNKTITVLEVFGVP